MADQLHDSRSHDRQSVKRLNIVQTLGKFTELPEKKLLQQSQAKTCRPETQALGDLFRASELICLLPLFPA